MNKIRILFLTILSLFTLLFSNSVSVVYASETSEVDITTSSVRDDLASMDEDKLSYVSDIENIFIAMSQYYDNTETLRTYVYINWIYDTINDYQHYINLSTSVMDENFNITEDFKNYNLEYVNNEETWYKFEVIDLPNLEETTRRYNINHIGVVVVGSTSTDDQYVNYFEDINKTYIFNGVSNNTIQVFRQEVETITITEKEVSFWCYGDDEDFLFWESNGTLDGLLADGNIYTDVWYIFFNTDKPMDELLEIDITYQQYDFCIENYDSSLKMSSIPTEEEYNAFINDLPLGYQSAKYEDMFYFNKHEQIVKTITPGTEKVQTDTSNWYGKHTYEYEILDNIMDMKNYQETDSEHFIFTDYADKYDWGVKFLTTERQVTEVNANDMPIVQSGSGVSNTAILRLKYKTDNVVHNAYAVDVPTDDFTGNTAEVEDEPPFEEWFEKLIALIGVLILIVMLGYLSPIFNVVFNIIITCIKWVLKGLLFVISAPFKMIESLFKTKKRK